jgi:hypothetical protein
MLTVKTPNACSDAQVRRIHAALLMIRNTSRRMLLDDRIPEYLRRDMVNIENLADLSESLIESNDSELFTLIDAKLKECC